MLAGAVKLIWEASPRLVLVFVVLQVLTSAAFGFALLVVRNLVSILLSANQAHAGFGSVIPELVILSGVLAFTSLSGSVQNYVRMLLAEEVGWLADQRVLERRPRVGLTRSLTRACVWFPDFVWLLWIRRFVRHDSSFTRTDCNADAHCTQFVEDR